MKNFYYLVCHDKQVIYKEIISGIGFGMVDFENVYNIFKDIAYRLFPKINYDYTRIIIKEIDNDIDEYPDLTYEEKQHKRDRHHIDTPAIEPYLMEFTSKIFFKQLTTEIGPLFYDPFEFNLSKNFYEDTFTKLDFLYDVYFRTNLLVDYYKVRSAKLYIEEKNYKFLKIFYSNIILESLRYNSSYMKNVTYAE